MIQFLVTLLIFALGIVGMALALHFSKWKKREENCCGGGHCATTHDPDGGECESKKEMIREYFENKIETDSLITK